MRKNIGLPLLSLFVFIFISVILPGSRMEAKPDLKKIIIISVDTLRADHLGCYGYPLNTSPNIDAFARDGIRFSNCYSLTPLTAPSFSTLLTSLPPHQHGAKRNGLSIYRGIKTLPYFLERYGYRSAAFISNWPLRKKLGGLHVHFDSYHEVFTKKRYLGIMQNEGEAPAVTEKTIEWLETNYKKRFFLWVQYSDPHFPYILHDDFTFKYDGLPASAYPPGTRTPRIKKYDSEIAYTDHHIGKLIEKLKELGIYDNTLIVFHADHGESFGEHNYFKHGRKLYNSTLHVPLVFKLPGNRDKGTVRRENVSVMDIGPTIFSELELLVHSQMKGVPLLEEDGIDPNREILLETYGGAVHFRRNSKKYHLKIKPIRYGILRGPFKIIYNLKDKTVEAYHQADDCFETRNIYMGGPSVLKAMKKNLVVTAAEITKYIRLNKAHHLLESGLSRDDLNRLMSLGYVYEKE